MNLRDEARDRPCQIRLPGVCNRDDKTTVLAHFRLGGVSGLGLKSHDLIGAWACSDCHDAVDRRRHRELERDYVRLAHLEGVVRTLNLLIEMGKVS